MYEYFIKNLNVFPFHKKCLLLSILSQMAEGVWTSSYCLGVEGFPKLLYATMQKLGIKNRPEYEGREYEEHETERCEVTVYIGKSEDFPDIAEAWSMTTTGFRFVDTYQAVARKALRCLCQIYEKPIARTPMRFFPPQEKDQPVWRTRMDILQGRYSLEDDPTVVLMTTYLLALDEQYDKQASELRKCMHRVEEAEFMVRKLHVQLAEAQAQETAAESRETAIAEALKEAKDHHVQELKDAYLVTRAKRRIQALQDREPMILEGIPIMSLNIERRLDVEGPSAPPPTEISHEALELEPNKEENVPLA
jgi:predicted DNA-binding protein